ncbi:TPA: ETX/MTX2 family pore-forming toxin [Providencia alcalifaciens]
MKNILLQKNSNLILKKGYEFTLSTQVNSVISDERLIMTVYYTILATEHGIPPIIVEITEGSAIFEDGTQKTVLPPNALQYYIGQFNVYSEKPGNATIVMSIAGEPEASHGIVLYFNKSTIIPLSELADIYGRELARKFATTCKFTSTTNYSEHYELADYMANQCRLSSSEIIYFDTSVEPTENIVIPTQTLQNNTSVPQEQTFTWTERTKNEFKWSITEALKVGITVSATVGVPSIAEGKIESTVELQASSTQESVSSKEVEWSIHQPVIVPAHTQVICASVISQSQATVDFLLHSKLQGYVAIWFDDQVDGHWLYFYRIDKVISELHDLYFIDTYGYEVDLDNECVLVTAKGTTTGLYGIDVNTTYDEKPL